MTNLKLKTISHHAIEGTSQLIWERLIVVIDKKTGTEVNSGFLGGLVRTHKMVELTKNCTWTKKIFMWEVEIWNGEKTNKKSFSTRKESNEFLKEQLLN